VVFSAIFGEYVVISIKKRCKFNFCGSVVAITYDIVRYVNIAVKSMCSITATSDDIGRHRTTSSDVVRCRAQCEHRFRPTLFMFRKCNALFIILITLLLAVKIVGVVLDLKQRGPCTGPGLEILSCSHHCVVRTTM